MSTAVLYPKIYFISLNTCIQLPNLKKYIFIQVFIVPLLSRKGVSQKISTQKLKQKLSLNPEKF